MMKRTGAEVSMGCKRGDDRLDNTSGVSEIIGAILLVSLVVAAVSLVAVILFSQPAPQEIPNLNFMTGMNSSKNTLYLYHNGGDTLNAGEFSVLVDGVLSSYTISGGGSQWSLGKNLVVPISPAHVPDRVQIIYNGSGMSGSPVGSGVVLREAASTNIVNSANISPDQAPYLDCSAVKNWACADQIPPEIVAAQYKKNLTTQIINFMKNNVNNGINGKLNSMQYHINFTVSKANSSIMWGAASCASGTRVELNPNDKVSVNFDTNSGPDDFILYGQAPQVWEMAGGLGSKILVTVTFANNSVIDNSGNRLCHTYIDEYSTVESTIVIHGVPVSGTPETSLKVNNTFYIRGPDASNVTLVNFKPLTGGLYLVDWPGSSAAPIFVIGWADQIIRDGVVQTGLGL